MMGLFKKMMRKRRNMRPRNMGMMAGLAGLRDRMRPARNMMFGGRRQLNPFLGMNNLPRKSRFLPPLSELPPQPGGNRAFLDKQTQPAFGKDRFGMPIVGRSSDIMPRDPGFGVNIPKRPPIMPGAIGMKEGGDADKSEFPDLSGDGKITQKDILIGKGVIKMQEGGDPADKVEKSFTDYQPEGLLKGTIFDYIPDGYQVSAFLQDKLSRPMPQKSDLPMIDNDADMMNIQRGRQEYQKFYFGLPEALRAGLPTPDEVYGDNQMSGDIDMMLEDLASPEKKSPNPPMMFR